MAKEPISPPTPADQSDPAADVHGPSPLEMALEQNKSKLAIAVVAIILAICAAFVFHYLSVKKQRDAAHAFTNAATIEEFTAVIDDHAGTVGAGNAHLRIADLLAREDAFDEALKSLESFLGAYPDHPRFAQGLFAKGAILQQTGDLAAAKQIFLEVTAEHKESDVAPLAEIRQGDIALAQGETETARQIFEGIPQKYPANTYINRIEDRLAKMDVAPPTEPSERQKKLKEEADAKAKEAAEAAAKRAEEARMKAEADANAEAEAEPAPEPVPSEATATDEASPADTAPEADAPADADPADADPADADPADPDPADPDPAPADADPDAAEGDSPVPAEETGDAPTDQ